MCIFRHNQACSRVIQAYSDIFRTLVYSKSNAFSEPWYIQNLGIFRTLVNSEPCHIQNPGIFRTLAYTEPWQIQNPVKHL